MAAAPAATEDELKRQLYNRQEYVVGAETQRKYGSSDVLVVGMTGLGCEVVKNLMLTGVRSITIADDTPVQWADLSSMFYATEKDVGKPRAATLEKPLAELNRYVTLSVHTGAVTEELIKKHHVVIYVDGNTTLLTEQNEVARKNGVKFVACESRGIAGAIFVDAGDKFTVVDATGEDTVSCVVTAITEEGVISCHDDKKHECCEGDMVYFTNLEGPSFLNSPNHVDQKLFKVTKVIGPFMLQVEQVDGFKDMTPLKGSGYLHTTKQPVQLEFKSLAEAKANPMFAFIDDDESKLTASSALHVLFNKLHENIAAAGAPLAVTDAERQASIVQAAKEADGDIDEAFAKLFVAVAAGNLNPMACVIGGLASQEVLKCASGKFTPVQQWLYYDCRELLTNGLASVEDRSPVGDRYDGSIAVLGKTFQDDLLNRSSFIVGAGALGCEFVKNYAVMGVGCGPKGKVYITDMDRIELSNLSRQFLFRTNHIGHPKSTCAAEAAKKINPSLNIISKEEKVAPETENIFNEDFWMQLDFVAGALDNVPARKYVDSRCVFYKKALFESGTLGAKCSTQPVIPYLTESYGSTYDPPEKSIPLCTLKNFPNVIEHTIQWSRDIFEKLFVNMPNDANSYLYDENFMNNLNNDPGNKPTVFANLIQALDKAPKSVEDCIVWARIQFEELFSNNIKQLLHNLPLDKVGENGELFWSGAKKPPTPLVFDASNTLHSDFIAAAASLYAEMHNLKINVSAATIASVAASTTVPTFVPAQVSFATSEKEKTQQEAPAAALSEADLPNRDSLVSAKVKLQATEFEKDDDANHHMDFITAVSNLRATNYQIPPEDKVRTKMIAGKIIPAMVTTTALVTGFVGFEMLKYLLGIKKVDLYKSAFINIALPLLTFTNPVEPKGTKHTLTNGEEVHWTLWDRFDIDIGKEMTLKELVAYMTDKQHIEPSMMSTVEGKLIFSSFGTKPARLAKKVSEVVEEIAKAPIPEGINYLCFVVTPDTDDEVEVPLVRYRFRGW